MLGLITDLRDDRAIIPAAALSRVRVLRFVCLHFDHHRFVRLPKNERYERLLLGACLYTAGFVLATDSSCNSRTTLISVHDIIAFTTVIRRIVEYCKPLPQSAE